MAFEVRRIREGEGARLREIRLRSLADAPYAYAATLEDAERHSQSYWDDAAARWASSHQESTFFAIDGDECIGLAGALPSDRDPDVVDLVAMWIAPDARRRGVGAALVEAVVDWAREAGVERVELWVTRGNDSAERLYERCGFAAMPEYRPLPSDPCEYELRMARTVTAR